MLWTCLSEPSLCLHVQLGHFEHCQHWQLGKQPAAAHQGASTTHLRPASGSTSGASSAPARSTSATLLDCGRSPTPAAPRRPVPALPPSPPGLLVGDVAAPALLGHELPALPAPEDPPLKQPLPNLPTGLLLAPVPHSPAACTELYAPAAPPSAAAAVCALAPVFCSCGWGCCGGLEKPALAVLLGPKLWLPCILLDPSGALDGWAPPSGAGEDDPDLTCRNLLLRYPALLPAPALLHSVKLLLLAQPSPAALASTAAALVERDEYCSIWPALGA
jgi:hypothetical protein